MSREFLNIVEHPLLQHKRRILRDKETKPPEFRRLIEEISVMIGYEATKDLAVNEMTVETPMGKARASRVSERMVVVSIMRAGNGMISGLLDLLPFAQVGHIGIYRDKFIHNTVEYFFRLPDDVENAHIMLLDPLLATGDTMVAALDRLKDYEVGKITVLTLLCAQKGLDQVKEFHPDVSIYTLNVEPELDSNGYLLPGVGDAGDRIYGTKHYEY